MLRLCDTDIVMDSARRELVNTLALGRDVIMLLLYGVIATGMLEKQGFLNVTIAVRS
ncbi:hypothetical protein BDW74DRAFT_146335 [Aspergillus multicolor]|uniref:uncharacterized protein n=1 Tax=Aspergillus multicolor TaxID=41759 RepID=UPI003CCD5D0E